MSPAWMVHVAEVSKLLSFFLLLVVSPPEGLKTSEERYRTLSVDLLSFLSFHGRPTRCGSTRRLLLARRAHGEKAWNSCLLSHAKVHLPETLIGSKWVVARCEISDC